jgi:hypothetical protein|tara:strand:- start:1652 stop:2788 length:1137 start_codon:yes stop_codon:yes gene_type:complete
MPHIPGHIAPALENPYQNFLQSQTPQVVPPVSREDRGDRFEFSMQNPLLDFVPVVGTAANWEHMGPIERAISLGLDAADLLTVGTSKAGTTPLKTLLRKTGKFRGVEDPTHSYLRLGYAPAWDGHPTVSKNWYTHQPELGTSVYQGIKFPGLNKGSDQYFMKPMPKEIVKDLPETDYRYGKVPVKEKRFYQHKNVTPSYYEEVTGYRNPKPGEEPVTTWVNHPLTGQKMTYAEREAFEVTGKPMSSLGSDTEALLDPSTIDYATPWSIPKENIRLFEPDYASPFEHLGKHFADKDIAFNRLKVNPNVFNPNTGKPVNLAEEFAKYDEFGNRINPLWTERGIPNLSPWIADPYIGTLGYTTPARGGLKLYDRLHEQRNK